MNVGVFQLVMAAGLLATNVQAQALIGSTLDCDITTLPYFEDFDGSPEESYPACWTKPNPFQGYPMTEGGYAHSGNYALKFKCNYSNVKPLYAVMPHINANFNNLQLTFWTRPEATWSNIFEVGYMTSPTDTGTFVPLRVFTGATYQWYAATECSDGTQANSAGISSFTTPRAIYPAPFIETFDSTSHLPACWGLYDGLANGVFADSATLSIHTTSYNGWGFSNNNVFGNTHASLNIYGMYCRYWLVTPEIDLSTLNNPVLTFDLAL